MVAGVGLAVTVANRSEAKTGTAELAASTADRTAEKTANRGSGRTHVDPATEQMSVAATNASFTSPADEPDPTTTTTAPPVTTTTVPPTTVPPTTVPRATTTTTQARTAPAPAATGGNSQTGGASYYAYKAGGCAHKTLPKGTVVTVTNLANGKTTTCVVNDRGPFVSGRIIDLDTSVFKQVASTSSGVFQARISW